MSNNAPKKKDEKLSKLELSLRDEIVNEAKKLALQKTSSAYDLISKTNELLRQESAEK